MERPELVILIGGASHAGKSTLAGRLAEQLGWTSRSTDCLAIHPGRPWRYPPDTLPPHVGEHYLDLDVDQLMASVLKHYRSLWPLVEGIVRDHAGDVSKVPLVLEGSALPPDLVATLEIPGVTAIWLIGDEELLTARIRGERGGPAGAALDGRRLRRQRGRAHLASRRSLTRRLSSGLQRGGAGCLGSPGRRD